MKKLMISLLILLLACCITGFSSAETTNSKFFGTVSGDVYENEFLGIGCKFTGWNYDSEEDIEKANQLTREIINTKDFYDIVEEANVLYLMAAESASGLESTNIVLQYENETYMSMLNLLGLDGFIKTAAESSFKPMLEQSGFQNIDVEMTYVKIGDVDFPGLYIKYDAWNTTIYTKQAYALYDNNMMTITVSSADRDITDDLFSHFYLISDNRTDVTALLNNFQEQNPEKNEVPNLNYYRDQETGTYFIIPLGWEQKELSKERQMMKMKMSPIDNPSASIMFSCQDLYGLLSTSQRNEMGLKTRQDTDSLLDAEMLAAMLDLDEKNISMRNTSDATFGICFVKQTSLGLTYDMKIAITIKNGYMIMFQMMDLYENYQDVFESVVDSVYFN